MHDDWPGTINTRPAPLRPRLPPATPLHVVRHYGIECADEDDQHVARRDKTGPRIGLALLLVSACVVVALILGVVL